MNNDEIKKSIIKLQQDLQALNDEFYRNNFSARQDFTKYSNFTTRLKVPSYTTTPSTGQTGEVIEVSGILYICSAVNTWTKVGVQV